MSDEARPLESPKLVVGRSEARVHIGASVTSNKGHYSSKLS